MTKPTQSKVMAGSYNSEGSPGGFVQGLSGRATTTCNNGFSSVTFKVTGPSSYSKTINVSPPKNDGTYTFNANWDTSDLRNGIYTVRLDVVEPPDGVLNACGQSGSNYVTAKLANPGKAPSWEGSPTGASDGSANVTLQWKKNPETDVIEYHVFRAGPDGTKLFVVSASNPANNCSVSGTTYTCVDPASNFPAAYSGSYSYAITALRGRPDYNSSEDPQLECATNNDPCVASSASDVRQVTLTAPTPTPSPSPTDSPTGGTSPKPGTGPTVGIGTPNGRPGSSRGGTSVLSFGSGGSGSSFNEFYSGTYSENLPYQPKTLIVGNGTSTPKSQIEAAAVSNEPPNYRTIMLPVAGGLLAFLSAAHVRRLLVHF